MDEKKEEAEGKAKDKGDSTETENTGAEEEKATLVEDAKVTAVKIKEENDRKEKLLAEEKKLLDRREALNALGGGSPAGTKPAKPAKLTDTEYAEALERGEVNPLKEDGFLK